VALSVHDNDVLVADADKEYRAALARAKDLEGQGQYREALPYYQKALDLVPAVFGKDHINIAVIQQFIAGLYRRTGEYAKAEPLYRSSLDVLQTKLGKDHPAVGDALNNLANLYKEMGQYANAEPLYQRSVQIWEAHDHADLATGLNNLALVYEEMGQYAKAESLYRRGLQTGEAKLGKDHPDVAYSLIGLASVYATMGQYAKAEPLCLRSLQIREAKLGKGHPQVADSLNDLGTLYHRMGLYAKAEPFYQRSLEIREARLGKDHPHVAASLNNLGLFYEDMGQDGKAESFYQRSLQILETKFGKDHPDVAAYLNNLANLYKNTGQYAKALPLYERSLQIKEAKLGKDHPAMADALNNLATLYFDMGQYAKAEALYQGSLQISEDKLGKDHPGVGRTLNNLALLRAATGQWDSAATVMDRQRRNEAHHVGLVLPVLAPPEQLKFLTAGDHRLANALSLGLARRSDPGTLCRSATWLLNAKAVAQQALTDRVLLERDASDPTRRKIIGQLTAVRQQQAALALAVPKAGQEAERFRQLQDLADRQQRLEQQLVQAGGTPSPKEWVDLDQVRAVMATDAMLIEVARFKVTNFGRKEGEKWYQPARYAVWLIPAKGHGDVRLIDLGEADKIDAAVEDVRKGLLAAQGSPTRKSVITEKGEAEAEKELQPALAALAKLVLQPLREHIDSRQQWLINPDGPLWLVPWAALPLDDKTYAIEKHTIRYLVSGRDLVTPALQGKVKSDGSVIMADPDFDIAPQEATALTAKLLGKQRPTNDEQLVAMDNPSGTRSASAVGRVVQLPGTAAEATAIKPKLQTYAGEEPWVYRGKNALEGVFKAFRSPKVVLLSTHGFFLEDQQFQDQDRAGLDGDKKPVLTKGGKLPENPLLRCGLLLAGCNQAAAAKPGQEDGVLTGLEIVGCDLRGTDLVVLSACETGLGQVRNGEGVAGLRQAFQLAGAQTVVASLWQVPDRDTALLMSDFFDSLARGNSKAEALREAQLARIKAHRDRDGAAHPFFWAAFTVTGK
jgi:CHAT domain-containing protein/tetratricopeptide (TPR) repeat protein